MELPHNDRNYSVHAMKCAHSLKTLLNYFFSRAGGDPNFPTLSPGIVAIGLDIKAAIDEGFKYYDFLCGEESYKLQFGAQKRSTMRIMR